MNDDFSFTMTPFDRYISNHSLQMMKLIIPFLPPQNQRSLAVYVKFLELRYTLSFFKNMAQKPDSPEDIFRTIKPYISPADAESIDQMISMMSMLQEMQNMSDENFDYAAMMSGMFAQDSPTNPQKEGDTIDRLDE